MILSAVGLYGLVAWFVELRRREIGVRIAPKSSGIHSALLLLLDQSLDVAVHHILTTIVAAESFTAENNYTVKFQARRPWIFATSFFVDVPEGTASLRLDLASHSGRIKLLPIDGMIGQVLRQTDREKINALMRNIFLRLRSEHYGVPVVYLHTPYVGSKRLTKWNPGTVMYDLFIDELAR